MPAVCVLKHGTCNKKCRLLESWSYLQRNRSLTNRNLHLWGHAGRSIKLGHETMQCFTIYLFLAPFTLFFFCQQFWYCPGGSWKEPHRRQTFSKRISAETWLFLQSVYGIRCLIRKLVINLMRRLAGVCLHSVYVPW